MNNKIKLQPHASATIDLMRFNGYSFKLAVADIIDNSLPVSAKKIDITISLIDNIKNNFYVLIEDDGTGMDENELKDAMDLSAKDLNSERNKIDLGKFGLGLKSASFSQCLDLLVISKRKNTKTKAMQWDLNFVKKNNDWSVNVLNQDEISSIQNKFSIKDTKEGTTVLWRQCDTIINGLNGLSDEKIQENINSIIVDLQKNLSLVYHKYITRGLKITVNGIQLEAMDPFCKKGVAGERSNVTFTETIKINKKNNKAKVTGYLLPHLSKMGGTARQKNISIDGDLLASQGVYFYRVDRLISWGSWHNLIRKSESNSLARVEISVGNDSDSEWAIEIKKSSITLPLIIKDRIKSLLMGTTEQSNRVGVRRVKRKPLENALWQRVLDKDSHTISYSINKTHPFIESYMDSHNIDKEVMATLLKLIETTIPTTDMQNDLAQRSFKVGHPIDGQFEIIKEDALRWKNLGISFEVYKTTMIDNPSYNLTKEQISDILIRIKEQWER